MQTTQVYGWLHKINLTKICVSLHSFLFLTHCIIYLCLGNESDQAHIEVRYVLLSHPLESHPVTLNANW